MTHYTRPGAIASIVSGEIAYTEFTAAVTVNSTNEAAPVDVVSAGAISFVGGEIYTITFFAIRAVTSTSIGSLLVVNLWDASTDLGRFGSVLNGATAATASTGAPMHLIRRLTPSAGSHTYRIRAWSSTGTTGSLIAAGAGGTSTDLPGFIRIQRV